MKLYYKTIIWLLASVGFLAIYALVDIIYSINLLQPLWWLQEKTHGWFGKIISYILAGYLANIIVNKLLKLLQTTKT